MRRFELARLTSLGSVSLLISATVSLATATATAADSGALDWEQCLERVRRFNPELLAASGSLGAAEAQVRGAWSGFLPQLSGALGYTYSSSGTTTDSTGSVLSSGSGGTGYYTASLSASQSLFSGFSDLARVDQAKASREVSRQSLNAVRARVSYDLKSAYTELYTAQESIRLSDEILRRREANLKLVTLRFEGGRENKGSILLSKAYLAQARYDRLQAERARESAQMQLARVLGLDADDAESGVRSGAGFGGAVDGLRVSGEVPVSAPPAALRGASLRQLALGTPDFLTARAQEASSEAALSSARAGFFPTLGVSASTSNSGTSFFPSSNRWSVGASLSWSLFSGGRDWYSTRAAIENYKAATATRENTARTVTTRLAQALASYQNAVLKVEVDQAFLEAAEARSRIGREKYNNGLLSFEDWDLIENDLIIRQRALLQSRRDRTVTEAAWEQAQGKGVLE